MGQNQINQSYGSSYDENLFKNKKVPNVKITGKRDSALTRKRVKGDNDSVIKDHLLVCNHVSDFEDFLILTTKTMTLKLP